MEAFINERSLSGYVNWQEAMRLILRATDELRDAGAVMLKDGLYFQAGDFKQRFNLANDLPKDERALLQKLLFRSEVWECWRNDPVSDGTIEYSCSNPEFVARDESICEASERTLTGKENVGILSAEDSEFSSQSLQVVKSGTTDPIELHNSASIEAVRTWIAERGGRFDPRLNQVPRDAQTVLEREPQRFERTGRRYGEASRRIYKEIETNRQFYVDDAHSGHSAHLEVFDAEGNHVGEANIDTGDVDVSKRDASKKLRK